MKLFQISISGWINEVHLLQEKECERFLKRIKVRHNHALKIMRDPKINITIKEFPFVLGIQKA